MHAIATYHVPGLFSFRTLTTNAFAARTLLLPTPASVKLTALALLIRRDGIARAEAHLAWLAPLTIGWAPPSRAAITAATVRIYKSDDVNKPLTPQVGFREYAHFGGAFGIAILDVPVEHEEDVEYALTHVRHFGVAESLVQPLKPLSWVHQLPQGFVLLSDAAGSGAVGDIACVVDDLGVTPRFARLSAFRAADRGETPHLGVDRRRLIVRLPLRVLRRGSDSYAVESLNLG